jgi:diguanylate cyclase (GGDEF)-like protein
MNDVRSSESQDTEAGLFSLSQIMHLMRVEFGRAQRYGYPLTVLAIAVDRIGHLRDLYGYDAKEAILDEVGRLLVAETRTCDFLGRMMDDRLLAVIPHTAAEGAKALGQRLLAGVRALKFESGPKEVRVSISIGATSMSDGRMLFFDTLVSTAETALAEAAEAGGDRTVLRDPIASAS